jgi:hypothetical protein
MRCLESDPSRVFVAYRNTPLSPYVASFSFAFKAPTASFLLLSDTLLGLATLKRIAGLYEAFLYTRSGANPILFATLYPFGVGFAFGISDIPVCP